MGACCGCRSKSIVQIAQIGEGKIAVERSGAALGNFRLDDSAQVRGAFERKSLRRAPFVEGMITIGGRLNAKEIATFKPEMGVEFEVVSGLLVTEELRAYHLSDMQWEEIRLVLASQGIELPPSVGPW